MVSPLFNGNGNERDNRDSAVIIKHGFTGLAFGQFAKPFGSPPHTDILGIVNRN
jgi:hypothetical protein